MVKALLLFGMILLAGCAAPAQHTHFLAQVDEAYYDYPRQQFYECILSSGIAYYKVFETTAAWEGAQ